MTRIVLFSVLSILLGCGPSLAFRGEFTLLSTMPLKRKIRVLSEQQLTGLVCFDMEKERHLIGYGIFERVVQDALADQPEGTLLVNVNFVDDGMCIHVTGLPATFE